MQQTTNSDGQQRIGLLRRLGNMSVWTWISFALVVCYLYSPWIFWIGGHFTPRMGWQGNALLTNPNGTSYGLRVDFMSHVLPGNLSNTDSHGKTILGSGAFCTQDGRKGRWKLYGTVFDIWASTNGKRVELSFSPATGPGQILSVLRLSGHFDGDSILIEESKPLRNALQVAPGSLPLIASEMGAKGRIEDGDERAFEQLCATLGAPGPKAPQ